MYKKIEHIKKSEKVKERFLFFDYKKCEHQRSQSPVDVKAVEDSS